MCYLLCVDCDRNKILTGSRTWLSIPQKMLRLLMKILERCVALTYNSYLIIFNLQFNGLSVKTDEFKFKFKFALKFNSFYLQF